MPSLFIEECNSEDGTKRNEIHMLMNSQFKRQDKVLVYVFIHASSSVNALQ